MELVSEAKTGDETKHLLLSLLTFFRLFGILAVPFSAMKAPNGYLPNAPEAERKAINSELWHACAGPLVSLPPVGSLVVYFPQGHSEQVAASMQKETEFIPSYPNLPSKMVCILHNLTLHADSETDEVYAQMTLQPVTKLEKEAILASEMGLKQSKQPAEFFCKTLTASDTSTHGGFSVPRRAAEKIFPSLDFTMQPPAQELVARDLHDNSWTFRHIYRGQPKRHLLTTGWSVFVSTKRLFAGDSVLFIRDEKSQLLLGVRRANRQQPAISSSVISSDSMHIGILAAAAHAAANNSPFVIFFNPRASPAEFVIPFSKYNKAMYTQVSLGMRFRMVFETEESGVRRYMGTITGISDMDPVRWKNSQWRNLQVGWDESAAGDRPNRVSMWDIETVVTPFYICPPPFFRPKFPKQGGMLDDEADMENVFKRAMPWLAEEFAGRDGAGSLFPGMSLVQWMSMQQNNQFPANQGAFQSMVSPTDDPAKLLNFQTPNLPAQTVQLNKTAPNPVGQLTQPPWPQQQQQQMNQIAPSSVSQQLPISQQFPPPPPPPRLQVSYDHPQSQQDQLLPETSNPIQTQTLQQNLMANKQGQMSSGGSQIPYQPPVDPPFHPIFTQRSHSNPVPPVSTAALSDQQLQFQMLQKLQQQQQLLNPSNLLSRPQMSPQTQIPQFQNTNFAPVKVVSALTDGDPPSCSTSPSTNNCPIPSTFMNRTQHGSALLMTDPVMVKHESPISKEMELTKLKGTVQDPLEATSGSSYCLDVGTFQQNYPLPGMGMECDVQSQRRNNLSFPSNMDGIGYESQKDLHNMFFNYGGGPRDIETELSTAAITFKPTNPDVPINEPVFNGLRSSQPQRRTYTKVQKRGSVGRCIDVTRYKGYDDLRHDLANMFGIEGQLEDTQNSDWKLVYVDLEHDILLVGDDPWDEFVSCVQSIKILSSAEVLQMSLDGNLGSVPVPNQSCSGTDSGNAWRAAPYGDHSAASFNR